jgi:uncharacterized damage-inducible protein DinB
MDAQEALREQLARLLTWEDAHAGLERAVADLPAELRGVRPEGLPYSAWELLEHLRRTQRDILDFCRDPDYQEPESMAVYWPTGPEPRSADAWDESVRACLADREGLRALALDPSVDLFARVPVGSGQTFLRELVLVADHSAYHVGQLVALRRLLGAWSGG